MKTVVFGSCLSNLTTVWLKQHFGFEQIHSVHHNRSDSFLRHYVDGIADMVPLAELEAFLQNHPTHGSEAGKILRNQYPPYLGYHDLLHTRTSDDQPFLTALRTQQVDLILLDNFIDISAQLMRPREHSRFRGAPVFLNPGLYANADEIAAEFEFIPYLRPDESAANWLRIYRFFRAMQPNARIFFLPFMYCTSIGNPERYNRAREFYTAFAPLVANEDLSLLPPLDVPQHLWKMPDWSHVDMKVYMALAGHIFAQTVLGLPRIPAPVVQQPSALPETADAA